MPGKREPLGFVSVYQTTISRTMCFAIIESAHASMPFKTRCELTLLRLAKDRQSRRPRMALFHGFFSLSGFYLNESVTEGFVCVSRAGMPETETKSLAPAFRLSCASHPLKWSPGIQPPLLEAEPLLTGGTGTSCGRTGSGGSVLFAVCSSGWLQLGIRHKDNCSGRGQILESFFLQKLIFDLPSPICSIKCHLILEP